MTAWTIAVGDLDLQHVEDAGQLAHTSRPLGLGQAAIGLERESAFRQKWRTHARGTLRRLRRLQSKKGSR